MREREKARENGTSSYNSHDKNREKGVRVFLDACKGAHMRKAVELVTVYAPVPTMKKIKTMPAFGFTDDEKIIEDPNEIFPVVIVTRILGHNIKRCLIDEGVPVDILY